MREKLIHELTELILKQLKLYAGKSTARKLDYFALDKLIREGLRQLNESDALTLMSYIKANIWLEKLKMGNDRFKQGFQRLLDNVVLFDRSGSLNASLMGAFMKEFLWAKNKKEKSKKDDVEDVETKTEKIVHMWKEPPRQSPQRRKEPKIEYVASDYKRFGFANKKRLFLSNQQARLLNNIYLGDNVFTEIQQCADETAMMFLRLFKAMETHYQKKGEDLFKEIKAMDAASRDYIEYGYWNARVSPRIYKAVHRLAENSIREYYGHKRKLDADYAYKLLAEKFDHFYISHIEEFVNEAEAKIAEPSAATQIALNALNKSRWKDELKFLRNNKKNLSAKEIQERMTALIRMNVKNNALKDIYFEAAKFMVDYNKLDSVKAYVQYSWFCQQSYQTAKPLTKTAHKKLFKTEKQLQNFMDIVGRLSIEKKLEAALKAVEDIYKVERKKVVLDKNSIHKIEDTYSETVNQLSEILDEPEAVPAAIPAHVEIVDDTTSPALESLDDLFSSTEDHSEEDLPELEDFQLLLIKKMLDNDNTIAVESVAAFARNHGVFKSRLINEINEKFYNTFEDNLIEVSAEGFELIEDYIEEAKLLMKDVVKN